MTCTNTTCGSGLFCCSLQITPTIGTTYCCSVGLETCGVENARCEAVPDTGAETSRNIAIGILVAVAVMLVGLCIGVLIYRRCCAKGKKQGYTDADRFTSTVPVPAADRRQQHIVTSPPSSAGEERRPHQGQESNELMEVKSIGASQASFSQPPSS